MDVPRNCGTCFYDKLRDSPVAPCLGCSGYSKYVSDGVYFYGNEGRTWNSVTEQTTYTVEDTVEDSGALGVQVGGSHYKEFAIQPIEFIHANGIPFIEGNIIKYVARWREKGGLADLEKVKHYVDLLIDLEGLKDGSDL